jgi:hypothetical protein
MKFYNIQEKRLVVQKESTYLLKTLDKSSAIIDILFQERSPLSIAQLNERVGNYPIGWGPQPSG